MLLKRLLRKLWLTFSVWNFPSHSIYESSFIQWWHFMCLLYICKPSPALQDQEWTQFNSVYYRNQGLLEGDCEQLFNIVFLLIQRLISHALRGQGSSRDFQRLFLPRCRLVPVVSRREALLLIGGAGCCQQVSI